MQLLKPVIEMQIEESDCEAAELRKVVGEEYIEDSEPEVVGILDFDLAVELGYSELADLDTGESGTGDSEPIEDSVDSAVANWPGAVPLKLCTGCFRLFEVVGKLVHFS